MTGLILFGVLLHYTCGERNTNCMQGCVEPHISTDIVSALQHKIGTHQATEEESLPSGLHRPSYIAKASHHFTDSSVEALLEEHQSVPLALRHREKSQTEKTNLEYEEEIHLLVQNVEKQIFWPAFIVALIVLFIIGGIIIVVNSLVESDRKPVTAGKQTKFGTWFRDLALGYLLGIILPVAGWDGGVAMRALLQLDSQINPGPVTGKKTLRKGRPVPPDHD
mmetsp:Transcript_43898/g.115964  ORF Transcript_43898/g.115964 Transcript_43898/m.115964 type:complete len:222 (-) Transcript_43898:151-816(-)|eukprot:CAMPEP_0194486786 /NCGR_PEP_ID=MMETSP0253-20130528/7305_1 /TAXON_ID=2966 /ORGANISM="Noctiluca scintillans" /LENGTH=221 /DNA_ID=CAMNT_0039326917 /DNA_START=46 /DNA_END=711 /DNA_ORIENTATION=-